MPDPTRPAAYPLAVANIYIQPPTTTCNLDPTPRLYKQTIWASAPEALDWMRRRMINDAIPDNLSSNSTLFGVYLNGRVDVVCTTDQAGQPVMHHQLLVDLTSRVRLDNTPEMLEQRAGILAHRRLGAALLAQAERERLSATESMSLEDAYPLPVAA